MGEYGGDIYVGHNYGGGGTAGQNYYHALSGIGNDIAKSMIYYHQQHVRYDQAAQVADALSRIGISPQGTIVSIQTDEKGKPINKDIRPILDKQALQMFQANNQSERVKATGALEVLSKLGIDTIKKATTQAIQDQGLTGQLKQSRKNVADTRTALNLLQAKKMLGQLPAVAPLPTGGQILAEQRSLRKERFNQRKTIADTLLAGSTPINDPQMLLSGVQFKVPATGLRGVVGREDLVDPATDQSGNIIPPKDATHAVLDDGTELPVKSFNRLYQQAQQWKELASPLPSIKTPPPHDIQNLLNGLQANPDAEPVLKGLFDKHYGQGAADLVLSAQDSVAKQQQMQQPSVDEAAASAASESDTSGEEPPPEEPSDAGGE